MTSRRRFLAGLVATSVAPSATWADVGAPAYLTAGQSDSGQYLIAGLSTQGRVLFRHALPARGHAAAAHPLRPEAVGFARRPGTFAHVIDCRDGTQLKHLTPPAGHHFYGHGAFSPDGSLLFTTENDYDAARGMIGVWDGKTYARLGAFPSGGIGPHEILWHAHSNGLVVANGGIETHPDSGRAKLNLATMQPSLSYIGPDGTLRAQITLEEDLHKNSIRHLTQRHDGTVGFAMQWQGDLGADVPILGLHQLEGTITLLGEDDPRSRNLNGYGGSVAFSKDGAYIIVSSPRGGVVQMFNCETTTLASEQPLTDVCGVAAAGSSEFIVTTGLGQAVAVTNTSTKRLQTTNIAWDNHLIPVM